MAKPPLRVPVAGLREGPLTLDSEASRYVARVHRGKVGDHLALFDPASALEARATIVGSARDAVHVDVAPPKPSSEVPLREVTLLMAVGKGEKLDAVIRDATELGATRVLVVLTARSVPRFADAKQRRTRWQRVAVEAARQCGRGDVPTIDGPLAFDEALAAVPPGILALCLDPLSNKAFSDFVAAQNNRPVAVLIGPEGGLTGDEVERAVQAGFVGARLGAFVLRTETAATAALGAIAAGTNVSRPTPDASDPS